MRKMKIPPEFSPIRIELFRVAAQRRRLTPYTLYDLGPPGRFPRLRRRWLRFFGQGFFDRTGDELIPIGKLPDPFGDLVGEGDDDLHGRSLPRSPAASRPPGSFNLQSSTTAATCRSGSLRPRSAPCSCGSSRLRRSWWHPVSRCICTGWRRPCWRRRRPGRSTGCCSPS